VPTSPPTGIILPCWKEQVNIFIEYFAGRLSKKDMRSLYRTKKTNRKERTHMPFINIKVLKGTLSNEKKAEMIKRVSETVAEIEASPSPNDHLIAYTWCVIEEVDFANWGVGGNQLSPEILKAVIAGDA